MSNAFMAAGGSEAARKSPLTITLSSVYDNYTGAGGMEDLRASVMIPVSGYKKATLNRTGTLYYIDGTTTTVDAGTYDISKCYAVGIGASAYVAANSDVSVSASITLTK